MDQPATESVEDRVSALFGGEPPQQQTEAPAPEEEAAPDVEVSEEDTEGETPEEEASAEPFAEVTDDEGQAYKVPSKLKDAFLRQKDYTQKTQALSALTKSAEDRIQFAEAKEQIFGTVLQDVVALRESQSRLAQLSGLDWAALYNADPGQALNLRHQLDTLKAEVDQKQKTIAEKASQYENTRKQHASTQWKLAVDGVRAKVGAVSQAEDLAMMQTVNDLGFSKEELSSRFADPRFLEAIYFASKYKALQGSKSSALDKISKAPPVAKPGAVNAMSAQVKQDLAFRRDLKGARDSQTKAKVIEQRLAKMFK